MPYMESKVRVQGLETKDSPKPTGELAYAVARLMDKFVAESGSLSWDTVCRTIRAVTGTADEFRRRFQDRYEEIMLITNGEVFPETQRLFEEKMDESWVLIGEQTYAMDAAVRSLREQAKKEEETD